MKTPTNHRRRPRAATLLVPAAGAVLCAGVFVAVGFAVVTTLGRPAPLVRVAARLPAAAGRSAIVWSSEVLDGRRVRSVCRQVPVPDHAARSLVALSDGTMAFTDPAGVSDSSGARAGPRLELEAVLAGCSSDMVRMLRQEIEPRFALGEPVSVTPGVRAGVPVYSLAFIRGDLSIELAVDRRTLAPFSLQVWDGSHVGHSRLHEMTSLEQGGARAVTAQ